MAIISGFPIAVPIGSGNSAEVPSHITDFPKTISAGAIRCSASVLWEGAFKDCTSIMNADFTSLTDIPDEAFMSASFDSIAFLGAVSRIGESAFMSAYVANRIDFAHMASSYRIEDGAFADAHVANLNLDYGSAAYIGSYAFDGAYTGNELSVRTASSCRIERGAFVNFKEYVLKIGGESPSYIGAYAFDSAYVTASIFDSTCAFLNDAEYIGDAAFKGISLYGYYSPGNVVRVTASYIGSYALSFAALESMTFWLDCSSVASCGEYPFGTDGPETIYVNDVYAYTVAPRWSVYASKFASAALMEGE